MISGTPLNYGLTSQYDRVDNGGVGYEHSLEGMPA